MTSEETPELIQAARDGDQKAQAQLVNMYSARIYNLGLRMLRNNEDAEDMLQETFMTALQKIQTFKGKSSFYTWLYRIGVNTALGKLRKQSRMRVSHSIQEPDFESLHGMDISDWPNYIETKVSDEEFKIALKEALDDLDEKYRSVFVLRDLEGLSTAKTAEMLDLSESNVKVRLMRARLFLRDSMNTILKREGWLVK
ncbi:MAG: sigma-70 family RNA polymerase sigma factor [Candidatus Marinimicrobia bacterium]|nr:sigma-70 family RNA polymerase sigma factor [Candidatus Neomarinimicrobiota bacterium]MCF7850797.1 sigma-70 family RNA polymerase sigma factor [Candidatus Neomarinimicrobiota bacterium]MCF7904793.1 sigma-70 family RNA polymerase sigma factor [Candidatus Neomarinimicrobiota bacterium]